MHDHAEAPTLGTVLWMDLFQQHHAVGDAAHLQVVVGGRHVIEQQDGALPFGQELLQREDLAPTAEGTAGQQAQFRQGVEHHPCGLQVLHVVEDAPRRRGELDLGRVEHRVLLVRFELEFRWAQFADGDAVQAPAVGRRHRPGSSSVSDSVT